MGRVTSKFLLLSLLLFLIGGACRLGSDVAEFNPTGDIDSATLIPVQNPTTETPRLLTVCMGREPTSLFLYGDGSSAATSVLNAVYDGPFEKVNYDFLPIILERKPAVANGEVSFEPLTVLQSNIIVDSSGRLVNLGEGVSFLPSGCNDQSCAQVYTDQPSIQMDQLVVRFKLRSGIVWSDGAPLTADDSVYSFEIADGLYPRARADLILHTYSYQALDDTTVEWRGVPGYRNADYIQNFFTPLPRHAWGSLSLEQLLTAESTSRMPIGWGPYVIEEWTAGDHISLRKNTHYFRASEDLPAFDKLVFRFIPEKSQAIDALLAGECDYLDETFFLESHLSQLLALQSEGRLAVKVLLGTAWEQLSFGIAPIDTAVPFIFQLKEARQAVALCTDRQRMVNEVFPGQSAVMDSYLPSTHPLFNPQVRRYSFDPQAGSALLESIGWLDNDNDPSTPRLSQGVPGVPDGLPFEVTLLTTTEAERQLTARILQESLANCGIKLSINSLPWEQLLAPGPEGPIFGRNFSLAQVAWLTDTSAPCSLFTSDEIPGPYPDYPKGWGGANAGGYNNPEFDLACHIASSILPDFSEYQVAQFQAQTIFSEDLPVLPLYQRFKVVVARPDLCGMEGEVVSFSNLWNIEVWDYGEACKQG